MFIFSKLVLLIPLSALAGILVIVSWNMSEIQTFRKTLKTTKTDVWVLICTFTLTVLTNLTIAIEAGIIISALSVIQRMTKASSFSLHKIQDLGIDMQGVLHPENIEVIQLKGSLFFGSIDKFRVLKNSILNGNEVHKVIIFDMKDIYTIDASGIHELENVYFEFKKLNIKLYICNLNKQPAKALNHSHLGHLIKKESIFNSINEIILHLKNNP